MILLFTAIFPDYQAPNGVPLGVAAQQGHPEAVKRLLEKGANINHQDKVIVQTIKLAVVVIFYQLCIN